MKMNFNLSGVEMQLSSTTMGTVNKWNSTKVQSRVYVKVDDVTIWYYYYSPTAITTDDEMIQSLYCLLSDALSYQENEDIISFFHEFGYDNIEECVKAYNGCKANYKKCVKLGVDLIESVNYLIEEYNV